MADFTSNVVRVLSELGLIKTTASGSLEPEATGLATDENGNITANIIPRTGTLVALRDVVNAGNPELAIATTGEIVTFNGTPSVDSVWKNNGYMGTVTLAVPLTDQSVPSGQDTPLALTRIIQDDFSDVSPSTDGVIKLPVGATRMEVFGQVRFPAGSTGLRQARIYLSTSGLAPLAECNVPAPPSGNRTLTMNATGFTASLLGVSFGPAITVGLNVLHDQQANLIMYGGLPVAWPAGILTARFYRY